MAGTTDERPNYPTDRIFHEDKLLANRVAAYLTANAFVTIAFVTILAVPSSNVWGAPLIESAIIALGLFLAFFFAAIGRRSVTAIRFWRACANAGFTDVPDSKLIDFFRQGSVRLDSRVTLVHLPSSHEVSTQKSIGNSVPWRWPPTGTPNDVVGVVLPLGVAGFWIATSFALPWGAAVRIEGFSIYLIGPVVLVLATTLMAWMMNSWPDRDVGPEPGSEDRPLLAVLGRGIQYRSPDGWVPSPDFEICNFAPDGRPLHSALPIQGAPNDPRCRIGGGQLNVDAAAALLKRTQMPCVLGYAHPAAYLIPSKGPSESAPMQMALSLQVPNAKSFSYPGGGTGDSTTKVEVENVFQLARKEGNTRIRFVTISPHVLRVAFYAQQLAAQVGGVEFTVESSEAILLAHFPDQAKRIAQLQASSAYMATVKDERCGLEKLQGPPCPPAASLPPSATSPSSPPQ